jgi:hypothetical protein
MHSIPTQTQQTNKNNRARLFELKLIKEED